MSVARRRRGWPAWGNSLSNGTGARIQIPQHLWAPSPLVGRGRAAVDEAHTPSEGSALGACLPACLGRTAAPRAPTGGCCAQGCCGSFFHPCGEPVGQPIPRDYSGGKNQRRQEGGARWLRPSSGQARQGGAPQQEVRQPPSRPLLRLWPPRALARRSPLAEGSGWGASQKNTAAAGFQAEWTALGLGGYRQELGY